MSAICYSRLFQTHAGHKMFILWALGSFILVIASVQPAAADSTPTLQFSTYLGGSENDYGQSITVDNDGNIYVTGGGSADFPATNTVTGTGSRVYVTKFDRTGTTALYSVFLGRGIGYGIAVDADGYAYVVGEGASIATVNAIQPNHPGGQDSFVAKLDPSGAVVYATYLGGSGEDLALGVALDAVRNVYVAGSTTSTNFPTENAYQDTNNGTYDVFVTRINAAGTALDYSTYLGGGDSDISIELDVDGNGNAYITGETLSTDFPTLNAYQPQLNSPCTPSPGNSCSDVFVAKFNAAGALVYSTYLGGNGPSERGQGIAVDSAGSAYVTGYTNSTNFPTSANALQATQPNAVSAFVTKFSADGASLGYSTYLGGINDKTLGVGIDINDIGEVFVVGSTWATDFPTVNPIQASKSGTTGTSDAFIAQLNVEGSALLFSTYLGGGDEESYQFDPRIALNASGSAHITGTTFSDDFPLLNAFQADPGGASAITGLPNFDSFVAKIRFPLISQPAQAAARNYFDIRTPTLTWTPITGATHYHVQVSKNKLFTGTPDFEGETVGNELFMTIDPLDDGLYYWRVQAQKANDEWGAWSPVESFTIYAG